MKRSFSEICHDCPSSTSSSVDLEMKQQQMQELDGNHNIPSTFSVDTETGHEFEVFLNFRGSDTRNTFTDYLYISLTDAGIRTFRDNEELRVGEEIGPKLMKSIKQSKIAIPIFSKNYASSKWCLKEVAEMVKCMKETKQLIMPVFLDVTPDEVQHQRGNYANPFSLHEKRFSPEMVRGWRHALEEVVKLKGLELNTVANGKQGKLVKIIVASVIRQLKKPYLEVKNILVGIEDRAEVLVRKLGVGTNNVRTIGVWGMGGIGKTTLAKFVYNQIVDKFESSSFLNNIRETSRTRGLEYLQSKLASDILRCKREEYANVGEGISVLKESLRDKKALILLDDVDDINQLNALAADVKWFGRGSRIIITTREKKVLELFHVQDPYEVALMDDDEALALFCQHAFGDKFPRNGFGEMARDIVNITGRLPLALEVIGSSLSIYRGREDKWKNAVEKWKVKPSMDVQDKLKISYESLDYEQKEIFLDIACFFIGMDVRLVIPMWKDAKLFPEEEIEVLLMKSLIKIEEDNIIWMHDQLRDLGRYIIEQENFKKPGLRSRLWHGEDTVNVLAGQQGTSKVEAISLEGYHFVEQQDCLDDQMFKNLPSLKVLELNGVRLSGNFQHLFHQLRWFGWHRENGSPPVNLILKNLIVLDLSRSLIPEQWIGPSSIQIGAKLKVLNLRNCRISRTPDFSACPELEILILQSCVELIYVHRSIELLEKLILLDMRNCSRLEELPKQMGAMESLVELLIDDTKVEELPISGGMRKLEILSASNCKYLREIPASIGSLVNLKRLQLGSPNLGAFPVLPYSLTYLQIETSSKLTFLNLVNLVNLKELSLDGNFELEEGCLSSLRELDKLHLSSLQISTLPEEMSSFLHLEKIHIEWCDGLQCIPTLPSSLTSFKMEFCHSLERLPDLSNLENLWTLEVRHCSKIKEIEGLGNLLSLRILETYGCPLNKLDGLERLEFLTRIRVNSSEVERLPDLSKSKNLRMLDVSGCENLAEIQHLCDLKKLETLHLDGCTSLRFLPELPNSLQDLSLCPCNLVSSQVQALAELESLQLLCISSWNVLTKLSNLSKLQRLEHLVIERCENIVEILGLEKLSNLRYLKVCGCEQLSQVEGLAELMMLQSLIMVRCNALMKLPNLSKLQSLKHLNMKGCKNIVEIPGLEELRNLRNLDVSECEQLSQVEVIAKLEMLLNLSMRQCNALTKLPNLSKLQSLEHLDVEGCKNIVEILGLEELSNLRYLNVYECEQLSQVEGLAELEMLQSLDMRRCNALTKLPNLSKLRRLESLDMEACKNIVEIPGLEELSSLQYLNVYRCEQLSQVEGLAELMMLQSLDMGELSSLTKLPNLSKLQSLELLDVKGCENIVEIPGLEELSNLRYLDVSECEQLSQVEGLAKLEMLQHLIIVRCNALMKLPNLLKLQRLERLIMEGCKNIKEIPGLEELSNLEYLDVSGCEQLSQFEGLAKLEMLQHLIIVHCNDLMKLPNLSRLQSLELLDMEGCENIVEIPGLEELSNLRHLNVSGCNALKLPDLSKQQMRNGLKIIGRGEEK